MISRAVLGFHCHGYFVRLCHIPERRALLTACVGALYEGVSEHRAASGKCTMQRHQRHQRFPGRALGLLLSVSLGPLAHLGNLFADEVQEMPGRASASNRISQTGTEQRVADAGAAHTLCNTSSSSGIASPLLGLHVLALVEVERSARHGLV